MNIEQPRTIERHRLEVEGIVQGVGFRPFVCRLADALRLSGFVLNHPRGVTIEAQGPRERLHVFRERLVRETPHSARIDRVVSEPICLGSEDAFAIHPSDPNGAADTILSPDLAPCQACLDELSDPGNRRYGYPFLNCTACGPRFTIVRRLPYDRENTTMRAFTMCAACRDEYQQPTNRRFHAQPNACPACGPTAWFVAANDDAAELHPAELHAVELHAADFDAAVEEPPEDACVNLQAIERTRDAILAGKIIAVKGVGGFHLVCDATNDAAVCELRRRKHRTAKPLAVMVHGLADARQIADMNDVESAWLTSACRPIVMLRKRTTHTELSRHVAPHLAWLGVILPQSPLHELLARDMPPLVLTSGNLSDEPLVHDNRTARQRLRPLVDAFLLHNRIIHVPIDDSVMRIVDGRPLLIRRARGFVPIPLAAKRDGRREYEHEHEHEHEYEYEHERKRKHEASSGQAYQTPQPLILGVGADLKSTFCLAGQHRASVSQHLGDMQELATLRRFESTLDNILAQSAQQPTAVACDLHPGLLSTDWARQYAASQNLPLVSVQHHHAHVAAVLAEHNWPAHRPVLGVCWDGTGYGTDGAIWGAEWLLVQRNHYQRLAHLKYVPLPGGDAAIRHPGRMALAHLWAASIPWHEQLPCVRDTPASVRSVLRQQLERNVHCVPTSSMGRLFDAVAALAGIRQTVDYEAQAAMELESLVSVSPPQDLASAARYRWSFVDANESPLIIDPRHLLHDVVQDVLAHEPITSIATKFHATMIDLIVTLARHIRDTKGVPTIALCGGVFQNAVILEHSAQQLRQAGLDVLLPESLPPNDAAISRGQTWIAGG